MPDENKLQYIWRIGNMKDAGLTDFSWYELANIINENLFAEDDKYLDESAYRKPYQNAKAYYEDVFSKMKSEEYSKEIDNKKQELLKERQKLNATKIEYARDIRHQSRFELFYENIKDNLTKVVPPSFEKCKSDTNRDKEYVLTIADIHAGSNFDIGVNKYSYEEMHRRFAVLFNYVVDFVKGHNLDSIKIATLGDCIQGMIHITDMQLNESSVVEATVIVAKTIANFLNELSKYCNIEYYQTPSSNHSQIRPLGTKASEVASEDIEYIIGNYIKDVLVNNKRIKVNLNYGEQYIEIPILDKFTAVALHGHQFKDIGSAIKEIGYQNKKFYDYMFIAHYHNETKLTSGATQDYDIETMVCPSFVGTCPYAKKIFKESKASCCLYGFDKDYGHTETYKIVLN